MAPTAARTPADSHYYRGDPERPAPKRPVELPPPWDTDLNGAAGYVAGDRLAAAVDVALLLGQPLLLTGEPGTGKTQLANSLSRELGLGEKAERFQCRSTSIANELFYTFNALAQYLGVQRLSSLGSGASTEPGEDGWAASIGRKHIRYHALGAAILRARPLEEVGRYLPPHFVHPGHPTRSVVLIDEIDKAPRDFPNDLLAQFEGNVGFPIPELECAWIEAMPSYRPVLVVTSNSEKNLPEAFLRRCVFFHIKFPDRPDLEKIVRARLEHQPHILAGRFLGDALDLFDRFRSSTALAKKPATAELLGWLIALRQTEPDPEQNPLDGDPETIIRSSVCLLKTADDLDAARGIIDGWRRSRR